MSTTTQLSLQPQGLPFLSLFCSKLHSSQLSRAQVSSCLPRCCLLSLPRTPLVTSLRRLSVQFLLRPPMDRSLTAASASGSLQTPLPPLGAPAPCSPSAVYTETLIPQSAVTPASASARIPRSKLFGTLRIQPAFPHFPAPRKDRLSANAPPLW
ncbi:hypothetical protein PGT21_018255 [Puccinia graminis f. sp. tritici]|uniref:Uncharacterized protein n=1 Tax=Puccinia graminis f. sp. tritici TaxID=56615 RepID=A0A5B0R0X9_PUCGR|nr:hypothetical protein PGT21_018255 [Puccinia graminis f. sp. tritici]